MLKRHIFVMFEHTCGNDVRNRPDFMSNIFAVETNSRLFALPRSLKSAYDYKTRIKIRSNE